MFASILMGGHTPNPPEGVSLDDVREAAEILEDCSRRVRRVLGVDHPNYGLFKERLDDANRRLKLMLARAPTA